MPPQPTPPPPPGPTPPGPTPPAPIPGASIPRASINDESRDLLTNLRDLLLEQHKLLLDRERAAFEKANGPLTGPGPLLALVLGDPQFAWLRQISTLVVEIDEALARRSTAGQPEAEALIAQACQTMRPRENGTEFQVNYYNAVQESPDIVIVQCRIESLLGM